MTSNTAGRRHFQNGSEVSVSAPHMEILEYRRLLSASPTSPCPSWTSYVGGVGSDVGNAIAVDGSGNVLLAGRTDSADLGGARNAYHGGQDDAFLAKLDPQGNLLWLTYLGGSGRDEASGLAVDAAGDVFVVGFSKSADFDGANNAFAGGDGDAFVAKVSGEGDLVWASYLGGGGQYAGTDRANDIAIGPAGNLVITGQSVSSDFPGAENSQSLIRGWGAFVASISNSGNLLWVTHLGNRPIGEGSAVALDGEGNILVTGRTDAAGFPGANNGYHDSGSDVHKTYDSFVAKLRGSGELLWATYIGGRADDIAQDIAVDKAGNAWVVGGTTSTDFEGANNAYHTYFGTVLHNDGFVAKIGSSGDLLWSTYLGGRSEDIARGIVISNAGSAWVVGNAASPDFAGTTFSADDDVFLAEIDGAGVLSGVTQFSGSSFEIPEDIALDGSGDLLIAGSTLSSDLPLARNVYHGGPADAFAARFAVNGSDSEIIGTPGSDTIHVSAAKLTDPSTGEQVSGVQVTLNGKSGYPFQPTGPLVIHGGSGNDWIEVDSGVTIPVAIYGGDGNDTIIGGRGGDTIYGNLGNDRIQGGDAASSIMGGLGNDTISGGAGGDTLLGGNGMDRIDGRGGNDYIEGRGKADIINGGTGDDTIWGGAGADSICGGDGNDWVDVGSGGIFQDSVNGGAGQDTVVGGVNDLLADVEVSVLG